ncbi:AfsR/SARP family transcriptional regulator [Micromonospora sp. WMMD558]|uniref:AfsR/SARP family transcriptional regulator n=1 Tax=Micromonospora sp. WMMD558 TaxID=3403462 RepID=UPI003BF5763F
MAVGEMRWPRQAVSTLLLALLLLLPPIVLTRVVGRLADDWPGIRQWVEQPLTEHTLTVAVTATAWVIWLMLAATVTLRAAARARAAAGWLRKLPLPTPLQATATGVAGAAALSAGAHTAVTGTAAENPLPATAPTLDHPADTDITHPPDLGDANGVEVPGGWLPRETAEHIAAAAALVWLRRRRAYQPHPPDGARDGDDLAPLPATVTNLQTALASTPPDAATGIAHHQPAGSIASLPPGRIALTGPGALDAARGMLVTTVLTRLRHPAPAAPLVITRTAATMLLGADISAQELPGVRVVDNAEAILASSPAAEDPTREETNRSAASDRPVLILESSPQSGPVAAALTAGTGTAIILSATTADAIWHVDAAGHTVDPRHPDRAGLRLCVLDPAAATDLLTVITQAHPPDTRPGAVPQAATVAAPERQLIPRQTTGTHRIHPPPHATTGPLDLRVLGEPTLLADGTPVPIRRNAALQVLVFLAVHPDGATTGQLVEVIWPGLPAHRLTGRLYTTLSDLRATLRAAGGLAVLDHTDNRYRLHPAHLDVDLWRLRTLAAHAATALTNPAAAWQAVVDAYTGDLAAGHPWPWLDPAREATRRHILDAYAALAAAEPNPRRALDLLQAGIRVDPYNQALHQRAIGILTALGDHDNAAELADTYAQRLSAAGLAPADVRHPGLQNGAEPMYRR